MDRLIKKSTSPALYYTLLIATILILPSPLSVEPQLLTTVPPPVLTTMSNPFLTLTINELGPDAAGKISVSSVCTGYFTAPDGTNMSCPTFAGNMTSLVDVSTETVGEITIVNPVLDTFWVSEKTNLAPNSFKEEWIVLNLTDSFLILAIEMTVRSPQATPADMRPRAMEFQRLDPITGSWSTWNYYSANCQSDYSISPTDVWFNTSLKCQNRQTISDVGDGNIDIVYRPLEEFRDALFNVEAIYRFFTTSAIRVRFKTPPYPDLGRSYYVVADLMVRYQCACFGHASQCGGDNGGVCTCVDNTAGNNCEKCLPMFNNVPWQMNTRLSTGFQCQACNCSGRSTSCQYSAPDNLGICTGCQYNTTGKQCELCTPGYYINPSGNISSMENRNVLDRTGFDGVNMINYSSSDICIPCNCNQIGSVGASTPCNSTTGQCVCKLNVKGQLCDTCVDGFVALEATKPEGCSKCTCMDAGTVTCDKMNGTCMCKSNVAGVQCDSCKDTFYGMNASNPNGCSFCDCDVGASSNRSCDVISGQCTCKQNTLGRDCRQTNANTFAPYFDYLTFEAEYSHNVSSTNLADRVGGGDQGTTFTGRGFLNVTPPMTIYFDVQVPFSGNYQVTLRYESPVQINSVSANITLPIPVSSLPPISLGPCLNTTSQSQVATGSISAMPKSGYSTLTSPTPMCLVGKTPYNLRLDIPTGSNFLLDSVVLIPFIDNLPSFALNNDTNRTQMKACLTDEQSVNYTNRDILGCAPFEYSVMIDLNAGSFACGCDPVGSLNQSCLQRGGQCYCKPNTLLRNCSQCKVNCYGFTGPNGCTDCGCHPNGSASLQCTEDGKCLCRPNVLGDKCDRCIDKNYGLTSGNGCQPCQCQGLYVVNDTCMDSGQCYCLPGVGGQLCTNCLPGYFGLTTSGCNKCSCNVYGSLNGSCDPVRGTCTCRANVQLGVLCDACKPGYFGLGPYTDDGCMKCYCSGQSSNCTSATGWFQTVSESKWNINVGDVFGSAWTGSDIDGNQIPVSKVVMLTSGNQVMQMVNPNSTTTPLYFVSPATCTTIVATTATTSAVCFIGNKASSYGLNLEFGLSFNAMAVNQSSLFSYATGDVVMKCGGVGYSLVADLPSIPGSNVSAYVIKMIESSWFKNSTSTGSKPTYQEFLQALYDVRSIMIRAKFSTDIGSVTSLYYVRLGYAINSMTGSNIPATNVEMCVCPPNYQGDHCQTCSPGFTNVNNLCVACTCNGHQYPGTTCDPVTGKCICTHYTTGDHCELCSPGYYGDATLGQPDSCKPCMCPGNVNDPSNSTLIHSSLKTCNTTSATTFVCNCNPYYAGDKCDKCAVGYYGTPTDPAINGGSCLWCDCSGYNDGMCDSVTGNCTQCSHNTTGIKCQQCMPNYYSGNITLSKQCYPCQCNGSPCDNSTGICSCMPGVDKTTGCTACLPGFYNLTSSGCTACNCSIVGVLPESVSCSQDKGECTCKSNFTGLKCDRCSTPNTYGPDCLSNCSCLTNYTINNNQSCDVMTGQCYCLDGFAGRICDTCNSTREIPASYTNIRSVQTQATHPNCSICGQCFRSLAQRATEMLDNVTKNDHNVTSLQTTYFGPLTYNATLPRISNLLASLNNTNATITQINLLINTFNGTNYFNISDRTVEYDSILANYQQSISNYTNSLGSIKSINPNSLATNMPDTPYVSMPAINSTLWGLIGNESQIFSQGEQSYNSLNNYNNFVMNSDNVLNGLKARVNTANQSMLNSEAAMNQADPQLNTINLPYINNKIINDIARQKTVTDSVSALAIDLYTTSYYVNSSQRLVSDGTAYMEQLQGKYSLKAQLFDPTGNRSQAATSANAQAQAVSNSVNAYCTKITSLKNTISTNMMNLSSAMSQLGKPLLSQNTTLLNSIINTNIDSYVTQVAASVNTISNLTVSTDAVNNVATTAQVSSDIAANLTNAINSAVNTTQLSKSKLDSLQTNLNSVVDKERLTAGCLNDVKRVTDSIRASLTGINTKANNTAQMAQSTSSALEATSNTTAPVKQAFQDLLTNMDNSLRSLNLTNDQLNVLQDGLNKNNQNLTDINNRIGSKKSDFDKFTSVKNDVVSCINDLWNSINSLNSPISLDDLIKQTAAQNQQISLLTNDITSLETDLNGLLNTANSLAPNAATCNAGN